MKNLNYLLSFLFILATISVFAQREKRDVGSFDEISLGTSADLYLTIGNTTSVELEGDDDDLEDIKTEVDGDVLKIRNKNSRNWNWNGDKIKVYITVPSVKGLHIAGSGTIYGRSVIKSDELKLSIAGSGDIELEMEAGSSELRISGSGGAELSGSAESFDIRIGGSGSVEAEDLKVQDMEISISGSGSAEVNVSESLDVKIAGSGSVYYYGDPDRVNSSSAGSGKVRKRG